MCDHGHSGHGHGGHGHDGDDHDLDHSACKKEELGDLYSLWKNIDIDHTWCLNEKVTDSIKKVFKPWDKKLDKADFVESDADQELLIHIPFCGMVSIKSICIIGGPGGTSPSRVKIFVNRDNLDFDSAANTKPNQELDLAENLNGEVEYTLHLHGTGEVESLTLFLTENWGGGDVTEVYYIGIKGTALQAKRGPIIANYEVTPMPDKNKAPGQSAPSNSVS